MGRCLVGRSRGLSDLSLITGFHKVIEELTSKSCSLTSTQNWPIYNAYTNKQKFFKI